MQLYSPAQHMDGHNLERKLSKAYEVVGTSCELLASLAHYSAHEVMPFVPRLEWAAYRLRAFESSVTRQGPPVIAADLAAFANALAVAGTKFSLDQGTYMDIYHALGREFTGLGDGIRGLSNAADLYAEILRTVVAEKRLALVRSTHLLQAIRSSSGEGTSSPANTADLFSGKCVIIIRPRGSP